MSAQNNFKGKYHEGTFSQGQGPIHGLEIKHEEENKGLLSPATSGRHLDTHSGKGGDKLDSRSEEPGFDIHGASYKGPQNWKPESKGETPNYDINK